jgi:acylphosphatase
MKSVELAIKGGKVVDVGYRPYLLLNAMYQGIQNIFAFNVREKGEEMVIVRIKGEDEAVTQYADFLKSNFPKHAEVEEIIERRFEGPVMEADKFLQLLQFEQINKAIPAIISIDKKQDIMIEKQDVMIGKQDVMIEKQDVMIGKQDVMIGKQDVMIEKQDSALGILDGVREDTSAIRNDISALRKDTSETLYEKYDQLSREITEIKATLSEIKAKVA